jgi:sarcosine oxidase subunit gamma
VAEAVEITEQSGFGLATIMARKGVDRGALGKALGVALPDRPGWASSGDLKLIGAGPGMWLALAEQAGPDHAARVQAMVGQLASVSDQSSGYVIHRLSGPGARTMLRRGAAIDFHPSSFAPGSAATTVIAHIGVILWQVDDVPTYDIACFRSYANSFRHWICQCAAAL